MTVNRSLVTAAMAGATVAALLLAVAAPAAAQESTDAIATSRVPAPAPAVQPSQLQPLSLTYRSTLMMGDGNQLSITSERVIGPATLEGRKAWRIATTTMKGPNGTKDVFYLDPDSLRPFHHTVSHGDRTIDIAYQDRWIRGYESRVEDRRPIEVSVPGPVFGTGGALDALLVSLPLAKGYETSFDAFDLASRSVHRWRLTVKDATDVTTPAGDFATFEVDVRPDGGGSGGGTYWVSRKSPRMVVESRASLPGTNGVKGVRTVLKSWSLTKEAAPPAE